MREKYWKVMCIQTINKLLVCLAETLQSSSSMRSSMVREMQSLGKSLEKELKRDVLCAKLSRMRSLLFKSCVNKCLELSVLKVISEDLIEEKSQSDQSIAP